MLPGSAGRPAGRPDPESVDVHRPVHVGQVQRTVDRPVDRPESLSLCFWAVDRVPPTVIFMTVGSRPGGRPPAVQAVKIANG